MFRQLSTVVLVWLAALGSSSPATTDESREGRRQGKEPAEGTHGGPGRRGEVGTGPDSCGRVHDGRRQVGIFAREKPDHEVTITKPFYLGKYEVTQEQWEAVMGSNPSHFKGPKNPVEQVSWDDCQKFLDKLNAKTGGQGEQVRTADRGAVGIRLPGGKRDRFCFGDDENQLGEYAWYDKNSGGKTHPVGEKKPNAWGLYDMHGNVWEWCADWWRERLLCESPRDDPRGPTTGCGRVRRGGGWFSPAWYCRSAGRDGEPLDTRARQPGLAYLPGSVGPVKRSEPMYSAVPDSVCSRVSHQLIRFPRVSEYHRYLKRLQFRGRSSSAWKAVRA